MSDVSPVELLLILACFFLVPFVVLAPLARLMPSLARNPLSKTGWIEGLRGCAASAVALNHAPLALANLKIGSATFQYLPKEYKVFQFFGSFGVQIFFCITGLLFGHRILNSDSVEWTSFFRKRWLRIAPAFISAATVALFIALIKIKPGLSSVTELTAALPGIFGFGLIQLPIVDGFDFERVLGVTWTLALEWKFYLFLPLVFVLQKKYGPKFLVLVTVVALLDLIITQQSSWAFFLGGLASVPLIYREFSSGQIRIAKGLLLISLLGLGLSIGKVKDYGLLRFALVTLMFASLAILRPKLLSATIVSAVGLVSYSFYLYHAMIIFLFVGAINKLVTDVSMLTFGEFSAVVILALVFATLISVLSFIYIERPNMLREQVKPIG